MIPAPSGWDGRYTANDVAHSPELLAAAERFLEQYRGDFDFLVRMQRAVRAQGGIGSLTYAQAKAVLNCMAYDGGQFVVAPELEAQPTLRLVPPLPALRPYFDVRAVFHGRYFTSTEWNASRSHVLNAARSSAVYHRERHEINFVLKTWCGMRWQSMRYGHATVPGRLLTPNPLLEVCKTCLTREENR